MTTPPARGESLQEKLKHLLTQAHTQDTKLEKLQTTIQPAMDLARQTLDYLEKQKDGDAELLHQVGTLVTKLDEVNRALSDTQIMLDSSTRQHAQVLQAVLDALIDISDAMETLKTVVQSAADRDGDSLILQTIKELMGQMEAFLALVPLVEIVVKDSLKQNGRTDEGKPREKLHVLWDKFTDALWHGALALVVGYILTWVINQPKKAVADAVAAAKAEWAENDAKRDKHIQDLQDQTRQLQTLLNVERAAKKKGIKLPDPIPPYPEDKPDQGQEAAPAK